ncbi:hypothetical protein M0805_008088 [Coniferiporia weirii]|nr:hypothetical protein M0805_008088 [Coniferiporia weirii]
MQLPTLANVRIRSTRDANQIFYAVARNVLPMTVRRLDAEERRSIMSGNVYVWEERGANSEATGLGIERWTDGMRWSPSRVRDEFLFYHQKEMDPDEAAELPPTRWARVVRPRASGSDGSSSDPSPDKIPHQQAANDPERLIKQTYSVLVTLPEDRQRGVLRKWHLTAYFTQATVDNLSTVDEMLPAPHVAVPEGWFRSARAGKARRDTGRQRQITFAQDLGPDTSVPGPSSLSPSSYLPAQFSSSPSFPTPQPQYSGYVQGDDRMQVDGVEPRLLLPSGRAYSVTPVPPPPHTAVLHAHEFGATYDRIAQDEGRDIDRERSAQDRITSALPNTYEPSPSRVVPSHSRGSSHSHPYANAYPTHTGTIQPLSIYFQPTQQPHPPLLVSVPARSPQQAGAIQGPHSADTTGLKHVGRLASEAPHYQQHQPQSFPPGGPDWQNHHPLPRSPPLENGGFPPVPVPIDVSPGMRRPSPTIQQPKPSSLSCTSRLTEEMKRSLIPLDNLENAVFPRRDPMDDALLRCFNGLRTSSFAGSAVEQ